MQDEISINQMSLSDRDAVLMFLKSAFPDNPRQSDERFWNWHFLENPNNSKGQIPVWLARASRSIVGQLAALPVQLNIGGRTVSAIWVIDIIISPEFRRRGIMKRLVQAAGAEYPYMVATFTNKQPSGALFKSVGWNEVSDVPRYHRLVFPGNAVKELSRIRLVRRLINAGWSLLTHGRKPVKSTRFQIRTIEKIDETFDELWDACRPNWNCSVKRSSAFLNWQFRDQPGKKYDVFGCFDGHKLLGYIILFFRKENSSGVIEKAAICDLLYHPEFGSEVIDSLLAKAIDLAIDRQAGGIVTDVIDPLLSAKLELSGFWKIKSGLEMMGKFHDNDDFYDARNWFLTRADSDISIFERPNL